MRRVNRIVWGIFLLFGGFVIYESLHLSYYGCLLYTSDAADE